MPLTLPVLARVQPETPSVMLLVAEARLREAEALLNAQEWDGAVYLAGYVAEMLLKVACCNFDPTFPSAGTVRAVFEPARGKWSRIIPSSPRPDQYEHSLLFWETVLGLFREASGAALIDRADALLLSKHLNTIRRHWKVELRYQSPLATQDEAQSVCAAARWLFDNRKSFGVIN